MTDHKKKIILFIINIDKLWIVRKIKNNSSYKKVENRTISVRKLVVKLIDKTQSSRGCRTRGENHGKSYSKE